MDLTGRFIEGTGSFEVKEISPPIESGQLVSNPDFSSDLSGWTNLDSAWTWINGKAVGIYLGVAGRIYDVELTAGRCYRSRVKVDEVTGTLNIHIGDLAVDNLKITSSGIYEVVGVAGNVYAGMSFDPGSSATVDWITFEEVPEGYPLMDAGDKYLECLSNGMFGQDQREAYGTWTLKYKKDSVNGASEARIYFISDLQKGGYGSANAYMLYITSGESISLYSSSPNSQLFITATSYIKVNVWYEFKITRTLNNEFSVYIRGDDFGDDWVLVSLTGGSGSNPVTNSSHITSQYMAWDMDGGDCIADFKHTQGVEQ